MRDGVKPGGAGERESARENLELRRSLAPAEGLEPTAHLFSAPPIEALEYLQELGEIARRSLEPETEPAAAETPAAAAAPAPKTAAPAPHPAPAPAAKSSDAQLIEALLEYHRLRGPTLGARTAPKAGDPGVVLADASMIPGERFSPVDVPVIREYELKTDRGAFRSRSPLHAILRPKSPKP